MSRLIDDIGAFLEANGFEYSFQIRDGFDVISVKTPGGKHTRVILPLEIRAASPGEARFASMAAEECIRFISVMEGYPIIIPEDRWRRQPAMMKSRLLSHLEIFSQAYARNCEVRRIGKTEAKSFLEENHSYGSAACRYCYGLFLKRHTGHIAEEIRSFGCAQDEIEGAQDEIGRLIAVATFSNARKWIKDGKEIRSYEWTRYASLPDMRVSGGMGKLLNAFIKEVHPDDIMSYADLEWSEGDVYDALGFTGEGRKDPVCFIVDGGSWRRFPIRSGMTGNFQGMTDAVFFRNFGSRKYRLKLTEYK